MSTAIRLEHLDQDRPDEVLTLDEAEAALIEALDASGHPHDLSVGVAQDVAIDLATWSGSKYEVGPEGRRILLSRDDDA